MNEVLKQRLVGALILIALGVVFWPIIFVEPDEMSVAMDGRIPPRPAVNTESIKSPTQKGLRKSPTLTKPLPVEQIPIESLPIEKAAVDAQPKQSNQASSAAKKVDKPAAVATAAPATNTRTQAPEKPALDADGVPIAWILQVASVSKAEKAEELRTQLLAMGYKAYVKKVHSGGNVLLRVYVGPKFERAKLDKIKNGVDTRFGVQSLVVRYMP